MKAIVKERCKVTLAANTEKGQVIFINDEWSCELLNYPNEHGRMCIQGYVWRNQPYVFPVMILFLMNEFVLRILILLNSCVVCDNSIVTFGI